MNFAYRYCYVFSIGLAAAEASEQVALMQRSVALVDADGQVSIGTSDELSALSIGVQAGCPGGPGPCLSKGVTAAQASCVLGDHCSCSSGAVCEDTGEEGECSRDVVCVAHGGGDTWAMAAPDCSGIPNPCLSKGASPEQAFCVFGDHCSCLGGAVCEDGGAEGECVRGSVCIVPAISGEDAVSTAPAECNGEPHECLSEGVTRVQATCVFGDHCLCSGGAVCDDSGEEGECGTGSVCIIAPEQAAGGGCLGSADLCTSKGAAAHQGACILGDHCACSQGYVCEDTMAPGDCGAGTGDLVHCVLVQRLLVTLGDARSLANLDRWNHADPYVVVDLCGLKQRTHHEDGSLNVAAEDWRWRDGFDGRFSVPEGCDSLRIELWDEEGRHKSHDEEWELDGEGRVSFRELLRGSGGDEARQTLAAKKGGELDISVQWVP